MKLTLFSFFLLLYTTSAIAQKSIELSYDNVSLETVLNALESKFDIKFSFNANNIKKEKITIHDKGILNEVLQKIQAQTSFLFEKINERYYIIRNKHKRGKITICGYLLDDITHQPLHEAFISNKSTNKTLTSDKNGFFQMFLSKPSDTIHIQFLGYKNKQFIASSIEQHNCSKIFLSQDNFQLGEVLLTEYVTSGISKQEGRSIVNINPEKLSILPRLVDPDVLQTLQFLPGIQSPNETSAGLHIRGGTPDHNLILWDGIKMYNTGHFFDILSIFNPYITENVKVLRSNTEARYGSRISGVIDITSKNKIPEKPGFGFGFNMTNADTYIEMPFSENFAVIFSGRRSFTDFIKTETFKNYSERAFQTIRFFLNEEFINEQTIEAENIFYFTDYTVKAIADVSKKDKIVASTIFTNNRLEYVFNVLDIKGFSELLDENQKDDLKFVNQGLSLNWDRKWNSNFSHSIKTYFSNYDFDYEGRRELKASSDGFLFSEQDIIEKNEIRDAGVSVHTDWRVSEKHRAMFGYELSTTDVLYAYDYAVSNDNLDDSFEESDNNISHSLYGEYRLSPNKKIHFDIGIRGNYFSVIDKVFWEPRLSANIKLFEDVKSTISVERKNQVIGQISNYLPFDFNLDNQIWLLANSEFTSVLKSDQLTTGFVFDKNNWYIDIEGYYKNVKGLTSFANGFNGVLDFTNGASEVYGVDLLVKKQFNNYRTWVGYSYTDQNFLFDDVNQGSSFDGNFDITHNLSWVHSYMLNNFEFSLGWNIRTGRPYTPAVSISETSEFFILDFGDTNSERLDTYHRLDFSTSYKFNLSKNKDNSGQGKISFSLFNLYNRKNMLNRVYDIAAPNNPGDKPVLQELDTFSTGLTPNLSFRVAF